MTPFVLFLYLLLAPVGLALGLVVGGSMVFLFWGWLNKK